MNSQNQNGKVSSSKSKGRGCLIWLGRIMLSIMGLALVGYIYEPMAEAADAKAYPPPGQLVDVGGYRLHINCTGKGSPTVVIEAGLGDWSTSWGLCNPKWRRRHGSAPMIELAWGGARRVHFHAMQRNSQKNCIPCCKKPMFQARM